MNFIEFIQLTVAVALVGVVTYFVGIIPLKLGLNRDKIKLSTLFCYGIITGTCFLIVVPEGLETLLESERYHITTLCKVFGISLIAGYIVMYFIEFLTKLRKGHYVQPEETLRGRLISVMESSLTLGLVLHGFVDGLSLSSSMAKSDESNMFRIIFFLVITFHKLPTVISLTSLLMNKSLSESTIKLHLLVFSLSTPFGAIFSSLIISLLEIESEFTIGILLVFSGGTLLFILTHIISDSSQEEERNIGSSGSETTLSEGDFTPYKHMGLFLGGICISLLLALINE